MAMALPDRSEIGNRVRRVREMANLSARQLRLALGSSDSNLISDIEAGEKKIVDYLRLVHIAKVCAGKGQLESVKWEDVEAFLTTRVDWDISPRPRPASGGPLNSTDDDGAMGGYLTLDPHLDPISKAA